jgi:hypothetical protein
VVAGAGEERVELAIADELGTAVDVEIAGELPRRHVPRPCVGQMEREERRLQLRFILRGDEHVDDIVVAEDDQSVVVYGIVCTLVAGTDRDASCTLGGALLLVAADLADEAVHVDDT